MANRTRNIVLRVPVTAEERAMIERKMQQMGTGCFSVYARKMLIDGYVIRLDYSDVKAMTAELQKIGTNINQIAKRVNATGTLYAQDIEDIKGAMAEIWQLQRSILSKAPYRQEVADRFNQLDEDSRRLVVRGDIKQWTQLLAETARNAGVITAEEFAIFQNAGYMGLYGGMTVDDIHRRKGLAIGQKILDYMGSTELIANLFRISQTEEKLRKDQVSTSDAATAVHYAVGNEVREAIRKIDGTMPEDLPTPEKSIAQLEREQMERLKQKAIDGQLMLDE